MDNLKIAVDDAITILQKEVAVRPGMKWYFVLTLTFKKAAHEEEVTDPPVVLNMRPKTGFVATDYERHLNEAMKDITEKIDSFESSGSGWIVDKFQTLFLFLSFISNRSIMKIMKLLKHENIVISQCRPHRVILCQISSEKCF